MPRRWLCNFIDRLTRCTYTSHSLDDFIKSEMSKQLSRWFITLRCWERTPRFVWDEAWYRYHASQLIMKVRKYVCSRTH